MLRGFGWLSVLTAVVKEVVKPARPPVRWCLICGPPVENYWLVKGRIYGCSNGHNFDVDYKTTVADPKQEIGKPARDYPGDI